MSKVQKIKKEGLLPRDQSDESKTFGLLGSATSATDAYIPNNIITNFMTTTNIN